MTQMLTLKVLGTSQVLLDQEPVSGFITSKAQALFFYLAVTGRRHSRDVLAPLLWPDVNDTQARKNLRDILPNLRSLVGSHLLIDRESVMFDRSKPYVIDVEQFRSTLESLSNETPLETLRAAVDLYVGEFLLGFAVRDAEGFEEWLLLQREQTYLLAIRGLASLTERALERQLLQTGLEASHRLLQFDPLHEQGVRNRMTLLALDGDRNSALSLYETFAKQLHEEVGVDPQSTTTHSYEQIRTGQVSLLSLTQVAQPAFASTQIRNDNLPRILTPIVGRSEEIRQLCRVSKRPALSSDHTGG